MLSIPGSTSVAPPAFDNSTISDHVCKGGRKIRVGDCALFQPAQSSPPFIAIIREVASRKEESIWLAVNWIYRPADVKLGRGTLLEASPNEVFFSFHKDEIPAASLLHPCKVAFLGQGVELPSGVSSYVCRRVYDIENKCLWWLTDKDYIKEQQEEVLKLLDKTRLEMDGEMQSSSRSPKPSNHPQLKPSSDSIKNSSSSLSSPAKGEKREHGDHTFDPVKHERISKTSDEDNGPENKLTSQIAKITQKGGLVDLDGVRKLVKLMHPEGAEMKIDLVGRIMLVDVISATDSFDCLGRFVQLRGLPLLDEWLQEVRRGRGKIGGGSSPKEIEKSVDEFLLAILRALEKLPVNLHSLQTCNVGKSVNYLRSHRNSEIQKKARSLVDIWKKRVEAEMNVIDAKSGLSRTVSWPSKPVPSEVSHAGSSETGCTKEVDVKTSVQQHATSKSPGHNLSTAEAASKVQAAYTGSTKSPMSVVGFNWEDSNSNLSGSAGNLDSSLPPIKEEKSSGSSQSQNTSQCGSGNRVKVVGSSLREDARSSTAGSGNANNLSTSASLHQKSGNGTIGTVASGVQKKPRVGKSSRLIRNVTFEEGSPNGVKPEKVTETVDQANNQRLIVRLPNTGRSPAPSASEGSVEEPTVTVKASPSSAHPERPGHQDRKARAKGTSERAMVVLNAESSKSKDGVIELDKVKFPPAVSPLDEQRRESEDCEILKEASKAILSSETALESGKSFEASFNSINALVDSCVKISEASASVSLSDDVGINLLASVAAGEISKSGTNSPFVSGSPVSEDTCSGSKVNLEPLDGDIANAQGDPIVSAMHQDVPEKNKNVNNGLPKPSLLGGRNGAQVSRQKSAENSCSAPEENHSGETHDASMALSSVRDTREPCSEGQGSNNFHGKVNFAQREGINEVSKSTLDKDSKVNQADATVGKNSVTGEVEAVFENVKVESIANNAAADSGLGVTGDMKNRLDDEPCMKPGRLKSQDVDRKVDFQFYPGVTSSIESLDEKANTVKTEGNITDSGSVTGYNGDCARKISDRRVDASYVVGSATHKVPREVFSPETEQRLKSSGCELDRVEPNGTEKQRASSVNASSSPVFESETSLKLDFDLNEGFPVDDEIQAEHLKSPTPVNSSPLRLSCPLPYPLSSMPGSFPTSITVAAAAKGPFVHPENLLRTKGELGWKGSAATSAFRPAEPRKVLELPLSTTATINTDSTTAKLSRPPLDIDLNVADERSFEDVTSPYPTKRLCTEFRSCGQSVGPAGGLDFDLNSVGECPDIQPFSVNSRCKLENLSFLSRSLPSGGFSNGEMSTSRNFDLNDGPCIDEAGTETTPLRPNTRSNLPFLSQVPGVTMSHAELGNISSWFPPVNSYSPATVPLFLPSRGEQSYAVPTAGGPQRMFVPSVNGEMFRGAVLSSSPALVFPPTTTFPYPGYPFEASFPVASNSFSGSSGGAICFPSIPSPLEGSTNVVPSHYPRPYLMGLPGSTAAVGHENRKWGNQGLDLNSGPRSTDVSPVMRPINVGSLSPAQVNEQLHMYQMAGGMFKRKEPDSGWDMSTDRYKHP